MYYRSKNRNRLRFLVVVFGILFLSMTTLWSFSFEWAPLDPLFREPLSDAFSNATSFRYLRVMDEQSVPDSILVANSETNQYEVVQFDTRILDEYWHMKSAVNVGLLRFSLGFIELEGYLQGGLNTVFQRKGSINALGFDGMYGAGASVRLFEKVVLSAGFHHFSGHWGDEIINDALEMNPTMDFYSDEATLHLVEYTRGNSWIGALSVEPSPHTRGYFIAELPMERAWIRPGIHVPPHSLKPGSGDQNQFDHITGQEGLSDLTHYDESYKGWRLQGGLEYRLPVLNIGSVFLAGEIQAHQDGKTKHRVGGYDQSNPWKFEYTVGGGFEFNQAPYERKIRLEVYYHDGRFPLLNYFFQRSRYLVMGIAING